MDIVTVHGALVTDTTNKAYQYIQYILLYESDLYEKIAMIAKYKKIS